MRMNCLQNKAILIGIKSICLINLKQLLKELGYQVCEIESWQYYQNKFVSLIVVDVQHYGVSAITNITTKYFRSKTFECNKQPIILAVVEATYPEKARLFELGAYDYLSSPLIPMEVKRRVNNFNLFYSSNSPSHTTPLDEGKVQNSPGLSLAHKTAIYLASNLKSKITLEDLAYKMGTNRTKLAEEFKNYHGVTIFNWLRTQRMASAVTLLETTALSVLRISEKIGYTNVNHFSTAFKKLHSCSPKTYRQTHFHRKQDHYH